MINVNIEIKLIPFQELLASQADLEKGADPMHQVIGRNESWQKDFSAFYIIMATEGILSNLDTCDDFHEIPPGIK